MKYVRRKHFKQYRKDGLPFIDCAKLAKIRSTFSFFSESKRLGFEPEYITLCECCGPERIVLTLSDGKRHEFSYYTFDYIGEYFRR